MTDSPDLGAIECRDCRTLVRAYLDTGLYLPRDPWEWAHFRNRKALSNADLKQQMREIDARRPNRPPIVGLGRPAGALSAGPTLHGAKNGKPKTWGPARWIRFAAKLVRAWVRHLKGKPDAHVPDTLAQLRALGLRHLEPIAKAMNEHDRGWERIVTGTLERKGDPEPAVAVFLERVTDSHLDAKAVLRATVRGTLRS